ncbi:methyl-accepting chemotaxis protein [Halorientalis pallida]|uniref:Methyl-accepting chemotaxis protein n=1 Tax=Halorientalis pallida TaxID=2479928 RepID=A0A498KY69_9EURY|nr:methyl-accepting chemotaxis protein [Halorientalis pallida]RXK46714.1 methyl-accepting chemotaxis protein [Halorientalis pallida]
MDFRLTRYLPDRVRRTYIRQFVFTVAVILLLLAVALLGVVGVLGDAEQQTVYDQLDTDTERNSGAVDQWLTQYRTTARTVSTSSSLEAEPGPALQRALADTESGLADEVSAVHYVDLDRGSVVGSTADIATASMRVPWITRNSYGLDGPDDVYLSQSYLVDGERYAAFVSPVPGANHSVAVEVSVSDSFDFQNQVNGSRVTVMDGNGFMLYDANQSSTNLYRGAGEERILTNTTAEGAIFEANGTVLSYQPVPGTDLLVLMRAPTSAYAVGWQSLQYLALIFGLVAGSMFLLGFVIVRPTATSINRLVDRAESIENGDLDVSMETTRNDEIGTLFASFASMRDSLSDRIDEIERAREEARADAEAARDEAEAARREAEEFNEHLEATADEYGSVIRACADGDLTRRLDPDDESSAMAEIARAFNETLSDLEETVARVRSFADDVAESTTRAVEATESSRERSRTVSESVQGIAEDAVEQNQQLTGVTDEMNDLSATVEEVAATANTVADLATETEAAATEGAAAASEAAAEMAAIETATEETVADVQALDDEVDRVAEIVDLIDDIAEQTNVLALNASIEAAHADGDGDGFAVVADEVKELAGQTREATQEIDHLLTQLSEQTREAVADIEAMQDDVESGVETTEGALNALEDIADKVEQTTDGVREISDATDDQAASAQEVVSMTDQATEVSERTADRAGEAADTATTQADQLESVTETARTIADQAADLRALMDEFTVDATDVAVDAANPDLATTDD